MDTFSFIHLSNNLWMHNCNSSIHLVAKLPIESNGARLWAMYDSQQKLEGGAMHGETRQGISHFMYEMWRRKFVWGWKETITCVSHQSKERFFSFVNKLLCFLSKNTAISSKLAILSVYHLSSRIQDKAWFGDRRANYKKYVYNLWHQFLGSGPEGDEVL